MFNRYGEILQPPYWQIHMVFPTNNCIYGQRCLCDVAEIFCEGRCISLFTHLCLVLSNLCNLSIFPSRLNLDPFAQMRVVLSILTATPLSPGPHCPSAPPGGGTAASAAIPRIRGDLTHSCDCLGIDNPHIVGMTWRESERDIIYIYLFIYFIVIIIINYCWLLLLIIIND